MLRNIPTILTSTAALLLAAAVAACSPLGVLNTLTPAAGYIATADIAYGPDPRETLDVYQPSPQAVSQTPRAGYPVVVFFYGGTWVSGDRRDYKFIGEALAAQGIVTVVADYRLYPQVRYPDFLADCARAVAWAQREAAKYGGDARRLYVMGHSSGAYNAAMLALDPHYLANAGVPAGTIKAAALLSGPYDFYPFTEQRGRDALGQWPRPAETQPINFVTRSAPPMLLATGSADDIVMPRNSQALAAKLAAAGVPVELKIYPGKGHVDLAKSLSRPFRGTTPALTDSAAFLHRVLGS